MEKSCWKWRRFKYQAGEEDHGAVALVLDLAKAFERVSLPVVWAWVTHFNYPRKIFAGAMRVYFEHQRRVHFEECVAEPLQTIAAILPGSKWTCLLLRTMRPEIVTLKMGPTIFLGKVTGYPRVQGNWAPAWRSAGWSDTEEKCFFGEEVLCKYLATSESCEPQRLDQSPYNTVAPKCGPPTT